MQRTSGIYSGAIVGIGNHMVCYKAKDESGNESKECCFWIYVRRKCDFWLVKEMDFTFFISNKRFEFCLSNEISI